MTTSKRSSLKITYSVWRALFLREMVDRLFGRRAGWMWLLLDPVLHIMFIILLYGVVMQQVVSGIDTAVWAMTGLLAYFIFNRCSRQTMTAVTANRALFTYRQVKPVDTIIVRAILEAFLLILVAIILLVGGGLFGLAVLPSDPLLVFVAALGLWLAGLGFGLVMSIPMTIVPEFPNLIGYFYIPLYMASGVILPMSSLPAKYVDWLEYNPLLHGVETVRKGFSPYYHVIPGLDLAYLYGFGLVMIFFGLALQLRFALRLATR